MNWYYKQKVYVAYTKSYLPWLQVLPVYPSLHTQFPWPLSQRRVDTDVQLHSPRQLAPYVPSAHSGTSFETTVNIHDIGMCYKIIIKYICNEWGKV